MKKHRWWHFIYGKQYVETIVNSDYVDSTYHCKKCKEQIGRTVRTLSFALKINDK